MSSVILSSILCLDSSLARMSEATSGYGARHEPALRSCGLRVWLAERLVEERVELLEML